MWVRVLWVDLTVKVTRVTGFLLVHSLGLGVAMNCGGERSVRTITLLLGYWYCYRNHFNSLSDWPLLAVLLMALPQEREVSIQEGGNRYGKISFLLFLSLQLKAGRMCMLVTGPADGSFLRHLFSSCLHPLWKPEWMQVDIKHSTNSV